MISQKDNRVSYPDQNVAIRNKEVGSWLNRNADETGNGGHNGRH